MWDCLSVVLAHDLPKTDAYLGFVAKWQQAQLNIAFQRLLQEAQDDPDGDIGSKLKENVRQGRGLGLATQIIDYLARQLGRERDFVSNILKVHKPMTVLVQHFSGGILLLVPERSLRTL